MTRRIPAKVVAAALVPLALWLAYTAVTVPNFFFVDDKMVQYSPTYHYIGEQLRQGNFPYLAPWVGASGALIMDSQYGLLNPIYWVQNILYSLPDNLNLATFVMASFYLAVLVTGVTLWMWRLSGSPRWSAVAGGAAGVSGFTIWVLAASWHPGLVSTAFLPWMAWSLGPGPVTRRRILAVFLATFATLAAGWPWGILAAVAIALACLLEAWIMRGWSTLWRLALAFSAGALVAAPTQIVTAGALAWTTRAKGVFDIKWGGAAVLDMFNTAQATAPVKSLFLHGWIMHSPLLLAGGLSVAVLPLVRWRQMRWKSPGVISLGVSLLLVFLLSQLPSDVGPLRWPFRMLAPWQILLIMALTLLLARCGVRLTVLRAIASALILTAFAGLSVYRVPQSWKEQGASLVLAMALMAAVVWLARSPRALPALGAVLGMIGVIGAFAIFREPRNLDLVDYPQLSASVSDYQHPLGVQPTRSLMVPYPNVASPEDILIGSDYLYGTGRPGWGYSPLGQRFYETRTCPTLGLGMCWDVADLALKTDPVTGQQWSELMGLATIVTPDPMVKRLQRRLVGTWVPGPAAGGFTTLQREDAPALPGRITYSQSGLDRITLVSESAGRQVFDVAQQQGGTVVLADVYWPGYQATFNGEPIEVFALDKSQVALRLPPGAGTLDVRYIPRWSQFALASAVMGLLLLGLLLIFARQRSEVGEPEPEPQAQPQPERIEEGGPAPVGSQPHS